MKKIQFFFLASVLLLQSIFSLRAQNTEGREFWISFSYRNTIQNITLKIRFVSGIQPASINIYFTALSKNVSFDIAPHEVFEYVLDEIEMAAVLSFETGTTYKSVHIRTSAPLSVYAYLQNQQYIEATNILPATTLSTEYYHISCHTFDLPSNPPDAYLVVATQNNTQLRHNNDIVANLR